MIWWAAWFGALAVAGTAALIAHYRRLSVPPEFRPHRFEVRSHGFVARSEWDARVVTGVVLLTIGSLGAMQFRAGMAPLFLVGAVSWILFAVRGFGRSPLTLTPSGVILRANATGPARTVPWGERLEVPRNLAVSPWFVSAAIEWYAFHPEDRAEIGTVAGHQRLLAHLGVTGDPMPAPRRPLPTDLKLATWFAYAGVALGILSAAKDMVLVGVLLSDDDFAVLQAIGWFYVAVIAGLVVVALVLAMRRGGDDRARVTVAVLAVLTMVLWPPNQLDGQTLRATGFDHTWAVLHLQSRIGIHLVMAGLAVGVLVCLTTRQARTHTQPIGGSVRP